MSVFGQARETVKRIPVLGPMLYKLYLTTFHDEGKHQTITGGRNKGLVWINYMRTKHPAYLDGTWEVETQDAIANALKPGDTFFDVGANAGFMSILAARLVGDKGKVVSFEPHPETWKQMDSLMKANNFSQSLTVQKAVSDSDGTISFADDLDSVMLSIEGQSVHGKPSRTITVPCTTLDTLCQDETYGIPDVIKIDIEGAEIFALRGAMEILKKHAPILIVELHGAEIHQDYLKLMAELGYTSVLPSGEPAPTEEIVYPCLFISKKESA